MEMYFIYIFTVVSSKFIEFVSIIIIKPLEGINLKPVIFQYNISLHICFLC